MQKEKNVDIQCLRAIAVTLVVLLHYRSVMPVPSWYLNTVNSISLWSGVDIFFAISGFLMYSSIRSSLSLFPTRAESARSFLTKRAMRLVPALIVALAFSVIVAGLSSGFTEAIFSIKSAAFAVIGISNLYWWACVSNVLDICGSPHFNGVTWSLSLEWQLYAILFAMLALFRSSTAITAALAISIIYTALSYNYQTLMMFTRPLPFFLGAGWGLIHSLHRLTIAKTASQLLLVSGVLIGILSQRFLSDSWMHMAIAAASLLCIIAASTENVVNRDSLITNAVAWIGDRSYSIYLLHYPSLVISYWVVDAMNIKENYIACAVISAIIIIVLSSASYSAIELRRFRFARVPARSTEQ